MFVERQAKKIAGLKEQPSPLSMIVRFRERFHGVCIFRLVYKVGY